MPMTIPDTFTRREILSQPEAWAAALELVQEQRASLQSFNPDRYAQVLFTGCGSTYYLALSAAALTQTLTGRPARAYPASELWLAPQSCYTAGRTLLVAVSRSGTTTETLRACQAFLDLSRGDLVTLSCYPETPFARMGTFNLVLPSGQEQSVAQTRAFSSLFLGTVALACLWAGRLPLFDSLSRLPEAGRRILEEYASLAAELGADGNLDRFYFLGSGPRHGLACELSLKMKEMSLSHSEPFHFLEFRHGPKSMVTSKTLVIGLRSSAQAGPESAVLADVASLGGRILPMGEEPAGGRAVSFRSGLDEAVRDVLYLPVGQLIALERSLSKGLNPDRPTNLDAVVILS
jgi:glucosamine--fructose-6-phosphate aminotransferase (isomerizing)